MSRPTPVRPRVLRYPAALRGCSGGILSCAARLRWSIDAMNDIVFFAALGALFVASPAFFFFGRKLGVRAGRQAEIERHAAAKTTAEETAQRIISDADREVETSRK